MSTEAHLSPEMAKKKKSKHKHKHKHEKGNTDDNTKKRKRDEAEAEAEQETVPDSQPEQRASKKQKKHREHHAPPEQQVKARENVLEQHSPFMKQTTSFYLPLSPCAYRFPLEGLCAEHISPLLLTYCPRLRGVLLSYENPRMSEHPIAGVHVKSSEDKKAVLARSVDEYAVTYVWLTADFLLFRPNRGTYLEGYVSLQNESILGLVCYNYFNAVIERDKLPKDWKWIDEEDQTEQPKKKKRKRAAQGGGYFVDGDENPINGRLVFKVEDFEATAGSDTGSGTVSILGTLRYEREET